MDDLKPVVLPDTNFLIDYPAVHLENWSLSSLEIMINETVINELRGLAFNERFQLREKALQALTEIEKYRGPLSELTNAMNGLEVTFTERFTDVPTPLEPQKPDHQLIAYARSLLFGSPSRFCAIISNDKELCDIAEALSVIVISRHNEQRFHQELERKYYWWTKIKEAELDQPIRPNKKLARKQQSVQPDDPEAGLNRFIQKLYRRFRAVGCRGTVYLAPFEARLKLTLEVIRRVHTPEKELVILVVESKETAQRWAGEIRQRGGFSESEVQVFGQDTCDRLDKCRVVIYRHKQIARRLPQHTARLARAQKRLISIVDGCDLLDPVELAILLYECDHFIGLNHFPIGYQQARGSRMLNVILHNQSLIDYSFRDAERDGWGHPCDPYFHELTFTSAERQLWNKLNSEYLQKRAKAIKDHPELAEGDSFWQVLARLLDTSAVPEIVDLIKLREQQEQMAQIAQNKLPHVIHLVRSSPHKTYRRLIFDCGHQWTPVLLKQLSQIGANVAKFMETEKVETWQGFMGNKIDTLLLSKVPPYDLPGAHIHQIIVLTPLRPLNEIVKMIDWTLSHTLTQDALRVDLLFVEDTPEELAMVDLGKASFDLR
jgi:rRNA-processing protein FCF1